MIVSVCINGKKNNSTGTGYGIRIGKADLHYFTSYSNVNIQIGTVNHRLTLNSNFMTTCNEILSQKIGLFLINHSLINWPKGSPYKLTLNHMGTNNFVLVFP